MKYRKLAFLLVALMMIFTPVMLSAQRTTPKNICMQAKMDAHKDVNRILWFAYGIDAGTIQGLFLAGIFIDPSPSPWYAIGWLIGLFGWSIVPMIIAPNPPPSRYIGMPPDYVALYTKCYKKEEKKVQLSNALIGCIISICTCVISFH